MNKIELHVHLDGSLRPSTVAEILNMDELEVKDKMMVKENNKDLTEYLTKFSLPIRVMQTEENLTRVAKELAEDLKNDGVVYAEVRFAPMFHTSEGLSFDEIVESVITGVNSVPGIKVNIILCLMRGMNYEDNLRTIECAKKHLNKGVVAVDLAGDEKNYPTSNYEKLFGFVKELGIPFTIHAGEAAGKESIEKAVSYGATRLGHGIRCVEDSESMKLIKDHNITLEICPTSNIQTKVVDDYKLYPLRKLIDNGIKVTINTDNRTVSNITLTKEYNLLKDNLNITDQELQEFNINALNASFISKEDKEKLFNLINTNNQ